MLSETKQMLRGPDATTLNIHNEEENAKKGQEGDQVHVRQATLQVRPWPSYSVFTQLVVSNLACFREFSQSLIQSKVTRNLNM